MKNSPVRRSHMPLAAVVISVVFFAAGCIIAVADDAVPGLGVAAFGLWGMPGVSGRRRTKPAE